VCNLFAAETRTIGGRQNEREKKKNSSIPLRLLLLLPLPFINLTDGEPEAASAVFSAVVAAQRLLEVRTTKATSGGL